MRPVCCIDIRNNAMKMLRKYQGSFSTLSTNEIMQFAPVYLLTFIGWGMVPKKPDIFPNDDGEDGGATSRSYA